MIDSASAFLGDIKGEINDFHDLLPEELFYEVRICTPDGPIKAVSCRKLESGLIRFEGFKGDLPVIAILHPSQISLLIQPIPRTLATPAPKQTIGFHVE